MAKINSNTTLGEIIDSPYHRPFQDGIEMHIATTFVELKEAFLKVLKRIFINIEAYPKEFHRQNEDQITCTIVLALNVAGYMAEHDSTHGGHCDIKVTLTNPNIADEYTWIGEAKFDSNSGYIYKGFQQLFTRYSSGSPTQSHGGMLIYIRNPNASHVMDLWKEYLKKKEGKKYRETTDILPPLRFRSIHVHPKSGLDFTVDHFPVMVHFDPKA